MNKKPIIIPRGEDRKIEIALSGLPDGVALTEAVVNITVTAGYSSATFGPEDIKQTSDGNYYIAVDTSSLGVGDITLSAHISIADEDFGDGYRDEYPSVALNAKIVSR